MVILQKKKLQASSRAFQTLASQAIGNDLLKGLVELITNSDDSYFRLEKNGVTTSGKIEIEIERRPRSRQTLVRVRDFAQGMDNQQMDECIAHNGDDVSGDTGRGFFGMGLKDTIINFGKGEIYSVKDGRYYKCRLEGDDFTPFLPQRVDAKLRKELGIANNGTLVSILVMNPRVRIPQFDTLREDLQNHVLLRLIMKDPNRTIILRDLRTGTENTLFYQEPEIEEILYDDNFGLDDYPEADLHLTIKKARGAFQLSQNGSCRTGGILFTTRRTVHESTMLEYDSDPFAAKLFGELRCEYIYELQKTAEPVVDRNRDGLRRNHPFTRSLFRKIFQILKLIVDDEKQKQKDRERELENENTRRRFREAVRELNQIASVELEDIGGLGPGPGPITKKPKFPANDFEFIPDTYRIVVGKRQDLNLRLMLGPLLRTGSIVNFSTECTGLTVINPVEKIPESDDSTLPVNMKVTIEAHRHGAEGFVAASCGDKKAVALVEVVSLPDDIERPHQPRRAGLFRDIKYENQDNVQRARFEQATGIIYINTSAPSVRLYFGPEGEGQDLGPNRVLQAELVTELACREIAKIKQSKSLIDLPPGIEPIDAFYNEINRLKGAYAEKIHECLVDSKFRRS